MWRYVTVMWARSRNVSALLLVLLSTVSVQAGAALAKGWPIGWLDADHDCQNTEVEVLLRDTVGLLQWGDPDACTIVSGQWVSLATGKVLPRESVLVIPLVMPGNAEDSGAAHWSKKRKRAFLNDMDNLIILDRFSARERADKGPEAWQPVADLQCQYANRWQQVKKHYKLKISEEEQHALTRMLGTCKPSVP